MRGPRRRPFRRFNPARNRDIVRPRRTGRADGGPSARRRRGTMTMADDDMNAGALASALEGRAVEGFSVDAQGGSLRLGLTGLLLELEGVDALFLEGLGSEGKIAYVGLWDGPATGEAAEDLELAQELLRIEDEKDPFSGGRIVIQLEPEADAGLHLVARFAAASVEEYDAPAGDGAAEGEAADGEG